MVKQRTQAHAVNRNTQHTRTTPHAHRRTLKQTRHRLTRTHACEQVKQIGLSRPAPRGMCAPQRPPTPDQQHAQPHTQAPPPQAPHSRRAAPTRPPACLAQPTHLRFLQLPSLPSPLPLSPSSASLHACKKDNQQQPTGRAISAPTPRAAQPQRSADPPTAHSPLTCAFTSSHRSLAHCRCRHHWRLCTALQKGDARVSAASGARGRGGPLLCGREASKSGTRTRQMMHSAAQCRAGCGRAVLTCGGSMHHAGRGASAAGEVKLCCACGLSATLCALTRWAPG